MKVNKYAKAIVAALAAAASATVPAMSDDVLSLNDGITIAIAAILAGAAVWGVPNKEAKPGQS